jgi:uncharacterized membrane protein
MENTEGTWDFGGKGITNDKEFQKQEQLKHRQYKNEQGKKLDAKGEIQLRVANGESKETIHKYIKEKYPSMSDDLIDSLITMRMNMYKQEKEEERKQKLKKFKEQLDRANKLTGKTDEQKQKIEDMKQKLSARIAELKIIKYSLKF